ncbi:unnamed protein product, partial [Pocillopora meandrina]
MLLEAALPWNTLPFRTAWPTFLAKDCCALSTWIGPCLNHFLWSATSTLSGNEMLIWAKFKSFLYHVVNKRKHLPDVIFNKCAHGD